MVLNYLNIKLKIYNFIDELNQDNKANLDDNIKGGMKHFMQLKQKHLAK